MKWYNYYRSGPIAYLVLLMVAALFVGFVIRPVHMETIRWFAIGGLALLSILFGYMTYHAYKKDLAERWSFGVLSFYSFGIVIYGLWKMLH